MWGDVAFGHVVPAQNGGVGDVDAATLLCSGNSTGNGSVFYMEKDDGFTCDCLIPETFRYCNCEKMFNLSLLFPHTHFQRRIEGEK